jgi:hypothetical protein
MFKSGNRPLSHPAAASRLCSRRLLRTHLSAALLAVGGVACGALTNAPAAAARTAAPPAPPGCPAAYTDQWPEIALGRRAAAGSA